MPIPIPPDRTKIKKEEIREKKRKEREEREEDTEPGSERQTEEWENGREGGESPKGEEKTNGSRMQEGEDFLSCSLLLDTLALKRPGTMPGLIILFIPFEIG